MIPIRRQPSLETDLQLKHVNRELKGNQLDHHTLGLSVKHLVTRRGQPFKLTLQFHDPGFNVREQTLVFQAIIGDLAVEFPVKVFEEAASVGWRAWVHPREVATRCVSVSVYVCSPTAAPVGLYDLNLRVQSHRTRRNYDAGSFILLCNPWLNADLVYLSSENQREEYVKSDTGVLYLGTPHNVITRPWTFGQYNNGILELCLKLLQVSRQHQNDERKDYLRRSDPIYLSRVVCGMINCEKETGLLKGQPSPDSRALGNSKDPAGLNNSADILKLWAASQFRPVCYGQCWMFASVMCTVMRALGIPCRVVTVFNSARDSSGSLFIEEFYTDGGKKLNTSRDGIWNYHLWVECWMARPDLGEEFDGWQVLDPTPYVKSRGAFCCGPCPVKAIRRQCVSLNYDAPFIFANVNATVVTVVMRGGRVVSRSTDRKRVGSHIYTKNMGSDRPLNITSAYKCVLDMQSHIEKLRQEGSQGLQVSLRLDRAPVIGEDIALIVTVKNLSRNPRTVREYVNAQAKVNDGRVQQTLWESNGRHHFQPVQALRLEYVIPRKHYEGALMGDCLLNVAVVVVDERTQELSLAFEEFNVSTPEVAVEVTGGNTVTLWKECSAMVSFTNAFSTAMIDAMLTMDGADLLKDKHQSRMYLLQPGQVMKRKVTFTPTALGTKTLHARVTCKNVPALVIRGFCKVTVHQPNYG